MAMRRDRQPAPDLKGETIAILLAGWAAAPPAGVDPGPHGFGSGMLELYDPHSAGFVALWNAHGDYLRAVAASWRWEPDRLGPDNVRRFYAEHLAQFGDGK